MRTVRSVSGALALTLAAFTLPAWAQRGGIRFDTPERRVEGKLVDSSARGVRIETESGRTIAIEAGPRTFLQVRAPGDESLLQAGAIVEVYGTATGPNVVEDAQITVFLGGRQVVSRFGRTYMAEADGPSEIPVVLVAQVLKTDPLLVKASNSVASEYYFERDKGPDGAPIRRHLFPTVGKVFEVKPSSGRDGTARIYADVGDALQLASPGDQVRARIAAEDGIARQISIFRQNPLTEDELNPGRKSRKKPTSRKDSSKKSEKRAPRGDKSKSEENETSDDSESSA